MGPYGTYLNQIIFSYFYSDQYYATPGAPLSGRHFRRKNILLRNNGHITAQGVGGLSGKFSAKNGQITARAGNCVIPLCYYPTRDRPDSNTSEELRNILLLLSNDRSAR